MSEEKKPVELTDEELEKVSGGDASDVLTLCDLYERNNFPVVMNANYLRIADGLVYKCSSYANISNFTRYFFIRSDGNANTLFSIDALYDGQVTDEIEFHI